MDAKAIAERLSDPQRGNFAVTLLTEPTQTTKHMLEVMLNEMLNAPELNTEDLVVIYISCHGAVYGKGNTFYLLPSDAITEADGMPKKSTVIDIHDLTKLLSDAKVKNTIFLLDVCHSGGAGAALEHLNLSLNPDTNLFVIGAARHDHLAMQSSTLKLGLFTSCLLQAFEQKPHRRDGWLTITDVLSFVTEAINVEARKLSDQEGPVQIQARSASVNPNLRFTKNPRYSPQSDEFREEVRKLLGLVQCEPIETDIPRGAPAGFYTAEEGTGFRTRRIGIIPYYNQVEPLAPEEAEKITLFIKEQVEQDNLNDGLLVTAVEVGEEVKNAIPKNAARYLYMRTYESIWKRLIDFNRYLRKLVDEYQKGTLEQRASLPLLEVYIPLKAESRQFETGMSSAIVAAMRSTDKSRRGYQVTWEGDLGEAVKGWLSEPTASRLALLGDYGSGKTTFCQHLAATLARDYLAAEKHEHHQQRIPLLIPLRNFGRNPVDLEGYLVAYLKQYCQVRNADAQALMKMAEAGLLLFLLDGFDEMAARATTDTVRYNIELFEQLANIPHNKVLLMTRPEYFFNLYQEQHVLQAYPCLYLQPFSEQQVDLYLEKRVPFLKPHKGEPKKDWKYYRQQIDAIHDLSDLARRPVLLEMIVKTLPVLVAEGEAVNRPNLYQRYLEGELDRQVLKQRRDLLIRREKRFEIIERIALELYRTDKAELTSKQILEISKELLTPEQQEEMEGSLREIVTCSFLIRTGNEYRFSHQSFLEYLVALRLAKDILDDKRENFRLKPLTRVIRNFLLEMEARAVLKSSTTSNDSLTTNITIVSFDQKKLESWFRSDPQDKWVSGNIVSLLVRLLSPEQWRQLPLYEANLEGVNLEGVNLEGVDLHKANLVAVNLLAANLYRAKLEGAELREAELGGADLRQANLQQANLRQADLHGAKLEGAELREAKLEGAKLEGADLRQANLRQANLHGANLEGAKLEGADLRQANLIAANLEGVNLEGAKLEGAILHPVSREKEQSNKPSGIRIHWLLDRWTPPRDGRA